MAIFKEKYGNLSKTSTTGVQLTDSIIRLGGQYRRTGTLNLSTATGLDTGTIAASQVYYVFAVVSAGVVSLKASLSNTNPTGFIAYKKVGAFYTDASSLVSDAVGFNAPPEFQTLAVNLNSNSSALSSTIKSVGSKVFVADFTGGAYYRITATRRMSFVGSGSYGTSGTAPVSGVILWYLNGSTINHNYYFAATGGGQNGGATQDVSLTLNPGEYLYYAGAVYSGGSLETNTLSVTATEIQLDWKDY